MKNRHDKIWYCVCGCKSLTSTLHELWFGPKRQVCEDYNLQIPVEPRFHTACHREFGKQEVYRRMGCAILGIEHDRVNLAINQYNYEYLESIKDQCLQKINGFEV